MQFALWLASTTEQLQMAGIGTARLDCLILAEDVTQKNRAWLLAHPEHELDEQSVHDLQALIKRRAEHEPLAYIRGKTEFYGRYFMIDHHVLEPRPESETMIDLFRIAMKSKTNKRPEAVIDVGTGSGALAITAKLEFPDLNVIATDIDPQCLEVASKNAMQLRATVKFLPGDLLQPVFDSSLSTPNSVILANLPYVPDDYHINEAALQEPRLAIFGGKDGLDLYRQLFRQLRQSSIITATVFTESLPFQHDELERIANRHGLTQQTEDDFIQVFILDTRR